MPTPPEEDLTHPHWELIDPTPDVHALFKEFDRRCFTWRNLKNSLFLPILQKFLSFKKKDLIIRIALNSTIIPSFWFLQQKKSRFFNERLISQCYLTWSPRMTTWVDSEFVMSNCRVFFQMCGYLQVRGHESLRNVHDLAFEAPSDSEASFWWEKKP